MGGEGWRKSTKLECLKNDQRTKNISASDVGLPSSFELRAYIVLLPHFFRLRSDGTQLLMLSLSARTVSAVGGSLVPKTWFMRCARRRGI